MRQVYGPYEHQKGFRIVIVEAGKRTTRYFPDLPTAETETKQLRREAKREALENGVTVADALDAYAIHMLERKKNRPRSIETTIGRIKLLFTKTTSPIGSITPLQGARLYEEFSSRLGTHGKPYANDTRLNVLAQAKTFTKWVVKRGWLTKDPLVGIEDDSNRKKGKPQLTEDEARLFLEKCLDLIREALAGGRSVGWLRDMNQLQGATAAACYVWMGPRASEVVTRQVRDVVRDAEVFIIPDAKTKAGVRNLTIPPALRPAFQGLMAGKSPDDRLFGVRSNRHCALRWVKRICKLAGVRVVGCHGLRGTHSTIAYGEANTAELITRAMGHENIGMTMRHYISEGAVISKNQKKVDEVLSHGFPMGRKEAQEAS